VNKIPSHFCTRLLYNLFTILTATGLVLLFAHPSTAQFTDNFSDGDFTSNPGWNSDITANWTIDNFKMRSNSSVISSSFFISVPSTKVTSAQWEFWMNLQFNTSSANYADVFLVSENQNLLEPGNNGYFVRVGGTPDEVSLYKMVNGTPSVLIDGTNGVTNSSNTILKIKVIRDVSDSWILSYDQSGTGDNYFSEPPVTDNTFSTGNFFGVRITQSTASFFNRHYFDDFYVGEIIVDTMPPQITSTTVLSDKEIEVQFDEPILSAPAINIDNYLVDQGIGKPLTATLLPDNRTVRLTFSNPFPNGVTCTLIINNVSDVSGNAVVNGVSSFIYVQPVTVQFKDILITELFADPSPIIGLPEAEFIELYNRSTQPVNLQGWKLSDPTSEATLPDYILGVGDYVIVTSGASATLFNSFGAVVGVSNFPTLNNSSDNLILKDNTGSIIDAVNYSDSWYKNDDKKQGGWTLELIDTENLCAESENWMASENIKGGTPGSENSVKANKPDLTGPRLIMTIPISENQLKLIFDEKLDDQLPDASQFELVPAIVVNSVSFGSQTLRELILELESEIQEGVTYTITINTILDCSGNLIQQDFNKFNFGLPEEAEQLDIVINELLFNPKPFGVDFIEIYNRSQKFINLKNWSFGNYESEAAINLISITTNDFLLSPRSIAAFTADPFNIKSNYPKVLLESLYQVSELPPFPDDQGSVSIVNQEGDVIDYFQYNRDFHSVFIRDKEGVSLERISSEASSNDVNNWKSASSTVGFATPGYVNSNTVVSTLTEGEVTIVPEIFMPVFGQPDFTEIRYNFNQGGRVANIKIVDHQGREIKVIANNETLATNGFYRWDGDREDGTKARPGYYVVWFEIFDADGIVETYRKRVVVAARY
jgi:hypothetical protein